MTQTEIDSFKSIIYLNLVTGMQQLANGPSEEFGIDEIAAQESADEVIALESNTEVNADIASHMKILWKDPNIKECWKERGVLQVQDSLKYFIENIDRIASPNYVPTTQDVLNARSRTTGIVEQKFLINQHPFLVVDVGGQRNERKKWIHAFDGVTAVIFVAALSAYDQILYEEDDINRMQESLEVFADVLKMDTFKDTDIILFLNKKDLFEDKLQYKSIKMAFPEYTDSDDFKMGSAEDFNASFKYIQKQFLNQNPNTDRQIFTHMTCATDTSMIEKIFNDVQRIIIDKALKSINLL